MAFNINQFNSILGTKSGPLKTNKFRVLFPPPQIMLGRTGVNETFTKASGLHFWCQDAQLPGFQLVLGNVRRHTFGPNESRPFGPNFQQIQLTFIADADLSNWSYFDSWLQSILPHDSERGINTPSKYGEGMVYELEYKQKYSTDMIIEVFDAQSKKAGDDFNQIPPAPKLTIVVKEAFPSNVNAIQLSWADNNNYATFTVFMEYLDWYTLKNENIAGYYEKKQLPQLL